MIGKTLSHYKVIEKIGQGGMGEVYRAEDTNLSRDVAIKVLPEQFTQDPQRLARFEREAKLLASLNHPNIAAIHSFEHSDDIHFLVLELVPGETLAERVAKGPVPVEEALEVCRQIAEGVEAAHEKGVIHRDLKPANVKVTPEGKVKILDFGLAKAFEAETPVTDISQSPTLTEEMTRAGVILGTAAYMSPEQAKGKPVDKRADIFAFGAVLYELLTGKRAFEGETITETLASILKGEPDWKALPQNTPTRIRELMADCLEKGLDDRLPDIGSARIQIKKAVKEPATELPTGTAGAVQPAQQRWVLTVGLVALGAVVAGLAVWLLVPPSASEQTLNRFVITPPSTAPLTFTFANELAISPDGKHVVYKARGERGDQLYLRSLEDFVDRPIPGTEGVEGSSFFSPDSESVGFFAQGSLKRVSLLGGSPITLCEAPSRGLENTNTGSWGLDDTVVFSAAASDPEGFRILYRISALGGEREVLATPNPDREERAYKVQQILPAGKAVLFNVYSDAFGVRTFNFHVSTAVLSMDTGEQKILIENGKDARYVETGHLIYEQSETGTLMAVRFDNTKLQVIGDPVQVLSGVRGTLAGSVDYAVSENGTLVYVPAGVERLRLHQHSLVWVDRQGTETPLMEVKRDFAAPRISPDGKQVAMNVREDANTLSRQVWIYDLEDDSFNRLTFGEENSAAAAWSPDSKWLVFQSGGLGENGMVKQPADRSSPPERLTSTPNRQMPSSWSSDGRFLAFSENPRNAVDIGVLPMEEDGEPEYIVTSPYSEKYPRFSPDGKWLAYVSTEPGQDNVYVRPFPEPDVKWLISDQGVGGAEPVWSPDGTELFYRSGDKMIAVSIQATDQTLNVGKSTVLFEGPYASHSAPSGYQYYDVSPDGKRFLMTKEETPPQPPAQINVVLNWFEELKRLAPTDN